MNKNRLFIKLSSMFLFVVVALMALAFNVSAATLGLQPTGICVSYYDDIDSRGFAWQTSTEATESKLLYIKDDGNVDWNNATVIDGDYVDFNEYRCHKAEVVDLAAGNYLYKVGGNNVYSEVGKFTIDDGNDNKVSFTYVTDSQETASSILPSGKYQTYSLPNDNINVYCRIEDVFENLEDASFLSWDELIPELVIQRYDQAIFDKILQ